MWINRRFLIVGGLIDFVIFIFLISVTFNQKDNIENLKDILVEEQTEFVHLGANLSRDLKNWQEKATQLEDQLKVFEEHSEQLFNNLGIYYDEEKGFCVPKNLPQSNVN